MWIETPDDALPLEPTRNLPFSDATASMKITNPTPRTISYKVSFLPSEKTDFKLSVPRVGALASQKSINVKVERCKKSPIGKEICVVEHLIIPDDYELSEKVEIAWRRARARKVSPWHQVLILKDQGKPSPEPDGAATPSAQSMSHDVHLKPPDISPNAVVEKSRSAEDAKSALDHRTPSTLSPDSAAVRKLSKRASPKLSLKVESEAQTQSSSE